MSEAPRVEINHAVFPDLDPSAPSNKTSISSLDQPSPVNGNANGTFAASAQKAGNSILESEVSGTARSLRALPSPT